MIGPLSLKSFMIDYIDELPLWSAPFGLRLLDQIDYRSGITALDIGFGAGFPLTEIAMRLGNTSLVYGIDPWRDAILRTRQKLEWYGISNVRIIEGVAESIPLGNKSVDLITSNNGINNVTDIPPVLAECARICKPGGQFVQTMNTDLSMIEFYSELEAVLQRLGMIPEIQSMHRHIAQKRPSVESILVMLREQGFAIRKLVHDQFDYTFVDGTTMLNHYFIRLAFLESWLHLVPTEEADSIFGEVEARLNLKAKKTGSFRLSIPFVVIDAIKAEK